MAKDNKDKGMDPSLAAAAFGQSVIENPDYDLGMSLLNGVVSAIDSLLGKVDKPEPVPAAGAKGLEAIHGMVQDLVMAQVCSYVWDEMSHAMDQSEHKKPRLDAKERAFLRISRAKVAAFQDKYEFAEGEKAREVLATPHPDDAARDKEAKDRRAAEVKANPTFQVGQAPPPQYNMPEIPNPEKKASSPNKEGSVPDSTSTGTKAS